MVLTICRWKELAKKGKDNKIPTKDDDKEIVEKLANDLKLALQRKETATSTQEKLLAGEAVEAAKSAQRQVGLWVEVVYGVNTHRIRGDGWGISICLSKPRVFQALMGALLSGMKISVN